MKFIREYSKKVDNGKVIYKIEIEIDIETLVQCVSARAIYNSSGKAQYLNKAIKATIVGKENVL